jgi:hypothetical protein
MLSASRTTRELGIVLSNQNGSSAVVSRLRVPGKTRIEPGSYVRLQGLPLMSGVTEGDKGATIPTAFIVGTRLTRVPTREAVINEYVDETHFSDIWVDEPTIFSKSVRFLKVHFAGFDPRRVRPAGEGLSLPFITVLRLVQEPELYAGRSVSTIGHITAHNLVKIYRPAHGRRAGVGSWLVQLKSTDARARDDIIYCRVPGPTSASFPENHLTAAVGAVLAAGAVKLSNGGFAQVAYLACADVYITKTVVRPRTH